MGGKAPDPPDLAPVAAGSVETAKIAQETAREQLQFARDQNTSNQAVLKDVLEFQRPIQEEQLANARKDRKRFEDIYQPLEDNLVEEFQGYDSPERQDLERGRAIADVNTQFDAARRNALGRLEGFGVDPSQTRSAALDLDTRIQQASATAGAANDATQRVEDKGRALRAEALQIGRGYPSNVAGSYGQSLQAGDSQVRNTINTSSTGAGLFNSANGALGTAVGGFNGSAQINNSGYQNQLAAYNSDQQALTTGIGAAATIAAAFLKDGGTPRRALRYADGGVPMEEPMYASAPGEIDYGAGDGSGIDDQVPIMASKDEYIVPADVVRAKGVEFFDRLVEKYHTPAEEQEPMPTPKQRALMNPPTRGGGQRQALAY